ncbi:hypothetical protein CMO95_03595 [Candidatus Woesearchaeota archaeon]|jgi:hypothetical protein|nr:hypothetical protein [Candidatus Woesearchaeota archaeon]|tara:strand:- start:271 stop:486 length:216 start_codon:yes stop_codon:yes gene_type:complete
MIDIIGGFTPSFFMARMRDPLKHGFYGVDYVLWGKDRVAVHFDMVSAQQAMMSMIKRGVEVKGMREIKFDE